MYPDLSYFFYDVFGTQPDNWTSIFKTFGLFLGLALLTAGYVMHFELKRKEKQGLLTYQIKEVVQGLGPTIWDIVSNALVGFIMGFKIPHIINNFEAFKIDPSPIIFSKSGNWLIGILAAAVIGGLYYWTGKKDKLPQPKKVKVKEHPYQHVSNMIMIAGLFGVFGSKLFSIFENMGAFFRDPLGMLFSGSGLNIFGGLIVALTALIIYAKSKKIPVLHLLDSIAPVFIMGYGIGRLGCQFSGDGDWGVVNTAAQPSWWIFPDWLWSYNYPNNVNDTGIPIEGCEFLHCMVLPEGVYPTPLYEIALCALIILIAYLLRNKMRYAGMTFFVVLFMNGIERFFIEGIRVNTRYELLGMNYSQAQYIAMLLMIAGIIGFFWTKRQEPFTVKAIS